MEIIKKHKVALVLALVVIGGVFLFFFRLYNNDVKALESFSASYEKFDKAISYFSSGKTDGLESKAEDALYQVTRTASFRLSSLIKNDAIIPPLALEIADLSRKELDYLSAYKKAIQNEPQHQNLDCAKQQSLMVEIWCGGKDANLDKLVKEYGDIDSKRKTAYTSFQGLVGIQDRK